jgi:hypothetical protein
MLPKPDCDFLFDTTAPLFAWLGAMMILLVVLMPLLTWLLPTPP